MNLAQVKPAQVREWLDETRHSPGWEIVKERIEDLMLVAQDAILHRGVGERDGDFYRGQYHAFERVLGLFKEIVDSTIEELQEPI
jgi:hypothetical protein